MEMISLDDFRRLELRIGRVVSVEPHPDAERLYLVEVDLGEKEAGEPVRRRLVAGLRPYFGPDDLVGRQVVVAANLEPATIRGVESRGMLLAVKDGGRLALLTVDQPVAEGCLVS